MNYVIETQKLLLFQNKSVVYVQIDRKSKWRRKKHCSTLKVHESEKNIADTVLTNLVWKTKETRAGPKCQRLRKSFLKCRQL